MPNAKQCLALAAECIDLANRAGGDTELQTKLFKMAEAWTQAAKDLEIAEARRGTKET